MRFKSNLAKNKQKKRWKCCEIGFTKTEFVDWISSFLANIWKIKIHHCFSLFLWFAVGKKNRVFNFGLGNISMVIWYNECDKNGWRRINSAVCQWGKGQQFNDTARGMHIHSYKYTQRVCKQYSIGMDKNHSLYSSRTHKIRAHTKKKKKKKHYATTISYSIQCVSLFSQSFSLFFFLFFSFRCCVASSCSCKPV